MKCFVGKRIDGILEVRVDGELLPMRLDLWNHNATGFECGAAGCGLAQLALAIASAILGPGLAADAEAVRVHQKIKWDVVAKLPQSGFAITEADVRHMTGLPLGLEPIQVAGQEDVR